MGFERSLIGDGLRCARAASRWTTESSRYGLQSEVSVLVHFDSLVLCNKTADNMRLASGGLMDPARVTVIRPQPDA